MSKTSFARMQDQKNFVGKLTFPFAEEVKDIFFHKSGKKYNFNMYWKGESIGPVMLSNVQIELFESIGYTFKRNDLNQNKMSSNNKFENIPIYAQIETDCNKQEIQVSYHAKDIIEVAARGKYILNKVFELTSIEGHGDIYGKMERC